ncbi:hypothetical protein [Nocardioides pacificus]
MTTVEHGTLSRRHMVIGFGAILALAAPGLVLSPAPVVAAGDGLSPVGWACIGVVRANGDLGDELSLQNATFTGGTLGDDQSGESNGAGPVQPGERIPVWCGFTGDDGLSDNWGWMYGGPGNDCVGENWLVFKGGTGQDCAGPNEAYFAGGPGDDHAGPNSSGRFDGGQGNDYVEVVNGGVFNGGPGNDYIPVGSVNDGTFNGGDGQDRVARNDGIVNGGRDADLVIVNNGIFNGGPGWDVVKENHGTCKGVEQGC